MTTKKKQQAFIYRLYRPIYTFKKNNYCVQTIDWWTVGNSSKRINYTYFQQQGKILGFVGLLLNGCFPNGVYKIMKIV